MATSFMPLSDHQEFLVSMEQRTSSSCSEPILDDDRDNPIIFDDLFSSADEPVPELDNSEYTPGLDNSDKISVISVEDQWVHDDDDNIDGIMEDVSDQHYLPDAVDIFAGQFPDIFESTDIGSVESAIAKEMAALSAEAREKAYMDMHGVPDIVKDEPSEFIQQNLQELENEIRNIRDKDAYNLAWNTDATYVEDEEFRLLFLRADDMNPKLAALRIVRHFQTKLDLFGPEKLTMAITQDDLDKDDMAALYSGRARNLPSKDRAGRNINLVLAGHRSTTEAVLRRAFYNAMSNPDMKSHERGMVLVVYALGEQAFPAAGPETKWKIAKVQEALPLRIVAIHMCQTKSLHNSLFASLMMAFNAFSRIRIRMHCGTHDEVIKSLQGYGIEPGSIPLNKDGEITDLEEYRQSLILRRARERLRYPRRSRIHVPCMFDVLFGKGTPFQDHTGNKRFRALIAEHREKYEKSGRGAKLQVAQDIVDNVIQSTGMFLKPDMGSWIIVDNNTARSKVSSTFRTMRRTKN